MENSERDGSTRPPDLPPEKSLLMKVKEESEKFNSNLSSFKTSYSSLMKLFQERESLPGQEWALS